MGTLNKSSGLAGYNIYPFAMHDVEDHCIMIRRLNMRGILQEIQLGQMQPGVMNELLKKRKAGIDSENQESETQFISKDKSVLNYPPSSGPSPSPSFNPKSDLARNFKVGQTWAFYDAKQNLPTSYVVIEECTQPRLLVSWLKPVPAFRGEKEWIAAGLPVSCGRFEYARTSFESPSFFSHSTLSAGDPRIIIPFEGETWAIYKDWDLVRWTSHPEMQRNCEYEYVEVLSYPQKFSSPLGVRVAHLDKIGQNSFKRQSVMKEDSFLIPANGLYRFSHRVPSIRKISDGDCVFEFDVRALPLCFFINKRA